MYPFLETSIRESTDPLSDTFVPVNDSLVLFRFCFSGYNRGMKENPEMGSRLALRVCQSRQEADGSLASMLVVASLIPVILFFVSPGPASAWVMGIFLFALGLACLRLVNSAAMVIRIREAQRPRIEPEILDAEILDVYEHPGVLDMPGGKSTTTLWLARPSYCHTGTPEFRQRQEVPSQFPLIAERSLLHVRERPRW
jgi:hypothetical protein